MHVLDVECPRIAYKRKEKGILQFLQNALSRRF